MARIAASATVRREPGLAPLSAPEPSAAAPLSSSVVPPADRLARALHDSARPLVVLASQLRRAAVQAPEGLKPALADAVQRFELQLAAAGWDERGTSAASYLLCAWLDEVVADTPWGAGGAGLLQRFHGEPGGSDRVLRLLSRLAERPQENRALLALFHACLSLGLHGHLPAAETGGGGKASALEQLRARVYLALAQPVPPLAPPCVPAVQPGAPPRRRARCWCWAGSRWASTPAAT